MQKYLSDISSKIKNEALRLGFDGCGIAQALPMNEESVYLKSWIDENMHGEMAYMSRNFEKRVNPKNLVDGARSVITVIKNYFPKEKQNHSAPVVSKYALGSDYHHTIKERLNKLLEYIKKQNEKAQGKVFVDTAPVLERAWAQRSGLGWTGKNSCLINKDVGSFIFIGVIIVNVELQYDEPVLSHCGTCTKCIDACPTGAIEKPYRINSNKCISYLTVEYKGETLPAEFKGKMQNRIFGCDICQDVCPWNKKAIPTKDSDFALNKELLEMDKESWRNLKKEKFNILFSDSPLIRAGYENIMRNLRLTND